MRPLHLMHHLCLMRQMRQLLLHTMAANVEICKRRDLREMLQAMSLSADASACTNASANRRELQ
jgi:hypothetical protein